MFTKIRRYIANKIYNFENENLVEKQLEYIQSLHNTLAGMNSSIVQIIPPLIEMNNKLQKSLEEQAQLKEELSLAHKALLDSTVDNDFIESVLDFIPWKNLLYSTFEREFRINGEWPNIYLSEILQKAIEEEKLDILISKIKENEES